MQTLITLTSCRASRFGARKMLAVGALAGLMLATSGAHVLAQAPKEIGTFRDWTAYVYKTDQDHVCYILSWPKKSLPEKAKRGEVYLAVSHRPRQKIVGEVSAVVGYPFKNASEAIAEIKGKTYAMRTHGERAWALDTREDRQLVKGLKAGTKAIIRGISTRGTKTTDSYSLLGFTAAYNAISKACK